MYQYELLKAFESFLDNIASQLEEYEKRVNMVINSMKRDPGDPSSLNIDELNKHAELGKDYLSDSLAPILGQISIEHLKDSEQFKALFPLTELEVL